MARKKTRRVLDKVVDSVARVAVQVQAILGDALQAGDVATFKKAANRVNGLVELLRSDTAALVVAPASTTEAAPGASTAKGKGDGGGMTWYTLFLKEFVQTAKYKKAKDKAAALLAEKERICAAPEEKAAYAARARELRRAGYTAAGGADEEEDDKDDGEEGEGPDGTAAPTAQPQAKAAMPARAASASDFKKPKSPEAKVAATPGAHAGARGLLALGGPAAIGAARKTPTSGGGAAAAASTQKGRAKRARGD